MEENKRRQNHQKDMIRLAWYTAYFMRLEKLEQLSTYLNFDKEGEKVDENSIDIEKAKKIYDKIIGLGQGGKNA
ncbi:MAG: hypothetical protein K2K85_01230 [Clostridia bacterium]|nr:hypothetical protein [Clostridia bacterium]